VPGLEIICDPSHIGGKRALLLDIAQEAMLLDFDGLMIESHINPEVAWSDAAQQVTPSALNQLLQQLKTPQAAITDPIFLTKLEKLRTHIDQIDFKVLELLAERMLMVREIGDYKKDNNITILQMERWAEIYRSRMEAAPELELATEFIESLINIIHKESIRQQSQIMKVDLPEIFTKSEKYK
jgi:chorismate mutase